MANDIEAAARALDRAATDLSLAIVSVPSAVDGARTALYRAQDAFRDACTRAALAAPATVDAHPSDMPPGFDWNPPLPDDAPTRDVLLYALRCAKAWEPGARLLGNLRACDLSRALTDTLAAPAGGAVEERPQGEADEARKYLAQMRAEAAERADRGGKGA